MADGPASTRRVVGVLLLVVGLLAAFCSGALVAGYYATSGFYDGPEQLADLGAGNVLAGCVGLLAGVGAAVAGIALVARRTS